ncbi:MAG TPA: type I glutamate--ammonia ligase [Candidatus Anaerostipes avistercoris]|uniref:Glutamine synthetase n=1 Tax=Candidatus Anaerostipes avistercoris TaxID=2838462 RepID=A0A9D2PIR4_9FIRM|nr:type I glutamate--ammonia ligase [uncultured Anaerostipes sp.]HJC50989.1 type I glutamate--ammonia ligase [Candidatus Anaerostipes avistercoris]
MGRYTKQDIIDLVRENDVQFIRLQFSDLFGAMKNVAITARQLEKALDNKCTFDGSSVDGFVRIEESDMYLYPDLDSFIIFPWSSGGRVARLICDVYGQDGMPFEGDPRNILKKVMRECKKMGYKFNVGPECEFFLFHTDEEGQPTTLSHEKAGYFDVAPLDLGESARRDMILNLEEMGFEIEASHHEVAPAQHEIDFKYDNALRTADNILTFKFVVKYIAKRHGLYASFMPKPITGVDGSGMHLNMSLWKNGRNIFADSKNHIGISDEAFYFMAGVMKHAREMSLITNPLVNSYKRIVPGYEAPVDVTWSPANRSPLIRVPAARGSGTRLEFRSPDPAANPYLALAVSLAAGLEGIRGKLTPGKGSSTNQYEMAEGEKKEAGIMMLPRDLKEALDIFEKSDFIRKTLGDHIFTKYYKAKKREWESYQKFVSQWEIDEYLYKF